LRETDLCWGFKKEEIKKERDREWCIQNKTKQINKKQHE